MGWMCPLRWIGISGSGRLLIVHIIETTCPAGGGGGHLSAMARSESWACHVVDPVFWALDLGAPATIQVEAKNYDFKTQGDAFPKGDIITYEFPANSKRDPITMKWYSGTERIPRPPELESDERDIETGGVVMGDKGTIVYGSHGAGQVRLIPQAKMDAYKKPPRTIPRVKDHPRNWLNAIRNGTKADSDFAAYGGPFDPDRHAGGDCDQEDRNEARMGLRGDAV